MVAWVGKQRSDLSGPVADPFASRTGHRHDLHGHREQFRRPFICSPIPWSCRSRPVPRCGIFPLRSVNVSGSKSLTPWLTLGAEWYVREEMQFRQALFFSAASVAGAFSGLLAFAIAKMNGVGGYAGWRWIFILEGLLTVVVGVMSFWTLYDFPDTAPFLTTEERAWVVHRLRYQGVSAEAKKVPQANRFQWRYVQAAFMDPQIYIGLISEHSFLPASLSEQKTNPCQCTG